MGLSECVCITADVIGSRTNNKENQLAKIVLNLNSKFKKFLVTKFNIRAGDEIFGVVNGFRDGFAAYKELYNLSKEYEVPFYVGVGFGEIVRKNKSNPDLVAGQAVWNSADALRYLKDGNKEPQYKALKGHTLDEKFRFHFIIGANSKMHRAVNYLLFFIMERVIKRTDKQRKAVNLIENYPKTNYNKLSEYLGYENENTREANFQKLLSRGDHFLVAEAEASLVDLIRDICEQEKRKPERC